MAGTARKVAQKNVTETTASTARRPEFHLEQGTRWSAPFGDIWSVSLGGAAWSALLLWLAFPPVGWAWLSVLAPWGWLAIATRPERPGKSGYFWVWLLASLHWGCLLQGIRLAHWANYFGLVPLAAYLGLYALAFVGTLRVAVQSYRIPVWFAAPAIWVGWELVRGYALTGFSIGLLGHAVARWPTCIQIADLGGAYAVSFVIMLVSAASWPWVARHLPGTYGPPGWSLARERRRVMWGTAMAAACLLGSLGYGQYRQVTAPQHGPPCKVALIQGRIDTTLETGPRQRQDAFDHYRRLTLRACQDHPDAQLLIWPESAFTGDLPERIVNPGALVPQGIPLSQDEFLRAATAAATEFERKADFHAREFQAARGPGQHPPLHLIVGTATLEFHDTAIRTYNSILHLDPGGKIGGRYYKMHPVPFGEYIPWGDRFPWLYNLTPLGGGLTPGLEPAIFQVADWRMSPSVCFESTVPHLIRQQTVDLIRRGEPPDALVNVTDDGWFRGSSILDLHLQCAVFRAIENRRPFLIAANTGISAAIDGCGRFVVEGPRREAEVLVASIHRDGRATLFLWWGDWPATIGGMFSVWLLLSAARRPRRASP